LQSRTLFELGQGCGGRKAASQALVRRGCDGLLDEVLIAGWMALLRWMVVESGREKLAQLSEIIVEIKKENRCESSGRRLLERCISVINLHEVIQTILLVRSSTPTSLTDRSNHGIFRNDACLLRALPRRRACRQHVQHSVGTSDGIGQSTRPSPLASPRESMAEGHGPTTK
jgi:hypothetical protein